MAYTEANVGRKGSIQEISIDILTQINLLNQVQKTTTSPEGMPA
jgi:hypothetical protein